MTEDHLERYKVTCFNCCDEVSVKDTKFVGGVEVCSYECEKKFIAGLIEKGK
jgi:hypothetical protein